MSTNSNPPVAAQAAQSGQQKTEDKSSSQKSPAKRNDDSNPQQGTGQTAGETPSGAPPAAEAILAASPRPAFLQRPSLKIPPTKKDDRKLFVGGLPSDGEW